MPERLERIVWRYFPLKIVAQDCGFDGEGKVTVPQQIIDMFRKDSPIKESKGGNVYYKLHKRELPPYLELSFAEPSNYSRYEVAFLNGQNEVTLPLDTLQSASIAVSKPLVFEGYLNRIKIYDAQNYKDSEDNNIIEGTMNLLIRAFERVF